MCWVGANLDRINGAENRVCKKKKGQFGKPVIIFELAWKRVTRAKHWYLHLADNPKTCTASQNHQRLGKPFDS